MRVLRKLFPLYDVGDLIYAEVAVRGAATVQTDISRLNKNIRLLRYIVKASFAFAVLMASAYAFAENYPLSIVYLILIVAFFSTSFSYSYFNTDFSYLCTFLTKEEVSRVRLLGFLRFYDWPLLIGLVAFAIVVAVKNPLGVIAAIPSYISAVAFSIALIILLSKKASNVHSAGSLKGSIIRSIATAIWFVTVYGVYALYFFISRFFDLTFPPEYSLFFPLTYGFWIEEPFNPTYASLSLLYLVLTALFFKFSVRTLKIDEATRTYGHIQRWKIKRRKKLSAMVLKDIILMSRSPQIAVLAFLPLFNSLAYLWLPTYLSAIPCIVNMQLLIALTAASLLSLEKSSYVSSLPISEFEKKVAKIMTALIIYFASLAILLGILIHLGKSPLNALALSPAGVAVVIVGVQFSSNPTNEPINPNAILAVILALFIIILPVAAGGYAYLLLKQPFALLAFPVSLIETAFVAAAFFAYHYRQTP